MQSRLRARLWRVLRELPPPLPPPRTAPGGGAIRRSGVLSLAPFVAPEEAMDFFLEEAGAQLTGSLQEAGALEAVRATGSEAILRRAALASKSVVVLMYVVPVVVVLAFPG